MATKPECPYCGRTTGLRQVHEGCGSIPAEYTCEGCFTATDTGPCFDDLPLAPVTMTPREAGIQAFYADESTTNTLQGLNAAFDAYEAAAGVTEEMVEAADENRIDQLRLQAFKTNSEEDRTAYFSAVSKWFQERHYRRMASEALQVAEPFGYWCECKGADPVLLRKPSYIPEPNHIHKVTPLYAKAKEA